MLALAGFLIVLLLSLIIVRIASVALTLTGLSAESAKFQARSAWTGTGFTTSESESVVGHPVRRKIVTYLMVLRSAGLVSAGSALVLGFAGSEGQAESLARIAWVLGGLATLWLVSMSSAVDRWMTNVIKKLLKQHANFEARDYASLLQISGEYSVVELQIQDGDWLAGRTLGELELPEEGVLVLSLTKPSGAFIGAPRGRTDLEAGDTLLLYGRDDALANLDQRSDDAMAGVERHEAVLEQKQREQAEADKAARAEETS
ncbi:MAG: TrkA C-terminal domain-containing protein [Planctomycetota bacterium]